MEEQETDEKLPEAENGFWALVELFGHQRIVGYVSEHSMGGETFVRVDVPEVKGSKAFTRLFGKGAIYSISPIGKDVAERMAEVLRARPIQAYELALPAIEDRSQE